MSYGKKIAAGLLAVVMLLSAMPVPALATETDTIPESEVLLETEVITEPENTEETEEEVCPHQYEAAVTKATCKEGGFTTYTCALCKDTYTAEAVDPTGVCRLEPVKAEAATCLETGIMAHYCCADCGAVYLDAEGEQPVEDEAVILPFAPCTPEPVAEVPATCTQTGTAAHFRCSLCEDLYWDAEGKKPVADKTELVLAMLDHEFGDWEVVEFPGPDVAGMETRHCLNCEAQEMQEIPALTCDLAVPKLTVKLDSETGKPLLSWTEVPGAEAYLVYRGVEGSEEVEFLGAVEELSGVDTTAQPGFSYFYTVMALSSTSYGELSEFQYYMLKCQKPVVTVTSDPASGKPSLTWKAVEGAMKYEVYRSTSSSKNFKLVATTEEPSAIVSSSSVGKKYYYKVKAICANPEANSPYSAVVSHICDCAQPVITLSSGKTSGIKVSWEKVSGAKKYQVYRASSENGSYTKIATTSSRSYTDTKAPKNKVSYYKVRAYGSETSSMGAYSEIVSLMNHTFGSWKTIVPSTPEAEGFKERTCSACGHVEGQVTPVLKRSLSTPKLKISADSATGKPKLSWGSIKGASKYYIYQVDAATGERTYLAETTSKSYKPVDTVVGTTYSYQIIAVSSTKCSSYSAVKSVVCKCAKPKLSFETEPVSGKPVAKWEAVEGAVKYAVYRSTSSSKNFKLVAETSELSVTIDSSAAGKTYYYRLKAIGAAEGTSSANSSTVKHVCDCAQPVITLSSGKTSGIKVSWEKVSGAKKYQVYRASSENGSYTKIATTSSASYTDTKAPKNKVSYYKVRAYGSETSSMGTYSEVVSLMNHTFGSWKTIVPSTPEAEGFKERTCSACGHVEGQVTPVLKRSLSTPKLKISTDSATGKPKLSWGSIKGASKYYIYQVDAATGERTYLAETTSKSYKPVDTVVGTTYSYQIIAVSSTKCSSYSAVKSIVCKCAKPTARITTDPVTGSAAVSWEAVDGAVKYEIYRSTSKSKNFKLVAQTEELSAVVSGGSVGKTYYYCVKAVGAAEGTASANSSTVKHICDCAQPVITLSSGTSGGIKVSWEKVSGAKKYQVYRASSKNGTYSRITTTSSLSYTDTKAPKNQPSYYKVRAYGSDTNSMSVYSQIVSRMNHTFGAWKTVAPNSPEAEGLDERICTYCGEKEQRVTDKLERTLAIPKLSLTSEVKSGKPTLIWNAVSKAKSYRVYLVDPETGAKEFLTSTESYTYVHESAQPGSQYTFCVVAVNATDCSEYSECLTALGRCAVPQLKIAKDKDSDGLILTWEQAENAVGYEVYRSTTLNAGYELYTTTQALTVTVTDNVPGVPQYFKIRAIHDGGADSVLSAAVSMDGECSELVIHAGTISAKCNKIVWGKIKDAKTYQVYRATSLNGSYSRIATVKGTEHVDLTISEGNTYYYRVEAYDSKEKLLTTSQDEAADKPCAVPLKIYISPSSQTDNKYCYGNTTEAKECRKIGQATVEALERCGFAAMINVTQDMYSRMPESNAWGANLHVPIHSNAFNESAMGTQVYHDGVSGSVSRKAARAIYNELAPLSPGTSGETIKKHAGLYEFNKSNNPTAYIEIAFHDTKTEAKWIINNTQKIAEAICKGICNTYGITYIAP